MPLLNLCDYFQQNLVEYHTADICISKKLLLFDNIKQIIYLRLNLIYYYDNTCDVKINDKNENDKYVSENDKYKNESDDDKSKNNSMKIRVMMTKARKGTGARARTKTQD